MSRTFRAALVAVASLVLTAAGETSDRTETRIAPQIPQISQIPQASPVQLAAVAPTAPFLTPTVDEDEGVAAPESGETPTGTSLRGLVSAIADLPSVELSKDMHCLASAVYFESKGEPLEGQLAVAQVIMNRVASGRFASDICGVVYQPGQFSFTWDGRSDTPADSAAWRAAQAVAVIAATDNWREVAPDATHFHATRVSPGWHNLRKVSRVGNHVFYR